MNTHQKEKRDAVPIPSGVYRHHKGGLYAVLYDVGPRGQVHYVSLTTGRAYRRVRYAFTQVVTWPDKARRSRFVYVGEEVALVGEHVVKREVKA